jgi:hypothetical protein
MRVPSILVACLLEVVGASPAAGQERAWFFSPYNAAHNVVFTEVSVDNGGRAWSPLRRLALPPHYVYSAPILAAGGRFIVWVGARSLSERPILLALDTRIGQLHTFSNIPLQSSLPNFVQLANDRRSGRLVVRDDAGLYLIDLHGRTALMTIPLPRLGRRSSFLATGHGHIFVGWEGYSYNTVAPHITVVDGSTGVIIGELPGESTGLLSADERRFFAYRYDATTITITVNVYDTETLELVSQGVLPWSVNPPALIDGVFLTWGPRYVGQGPYDLLPVIGANSATTFARLGQIAPEQLRHRSSVYGSDVTFSTGFGGTTLYVKSYVRPVQDIEGCGSSPRIHVFDLRTFAYLGTVDPSQFGFNVCYPARYLTPPDPPTRLRTGIVTGTVHLEWDPPADITEYEIVVGSRPDGSDIGVFRTYGKAFADFQGAPTGTYHVRVRARNELGTAESGEIKVVVP